MTDQAGFRSRVRAWPVDEAARAALESYLEALPADLRVVSSLDGVTLDFTGADLSGLPLVAAGLFGACLAGVRLVGADLHEAELSGADLSGADLSRANLFAVEARECAASGARFKEAVLTSAAFPRADLREADLRQADLNAVFAFRADLRGADLRGCRFGDQDNPTSLKEARLYGARFDGAHGWISGPVDVGETKPRLIGGAEATAWFREHGAAGMSAA
ncbi:pentapeptide repeat-containing protein [Actinomadura kijaniata]|uniref:pentapeptide repeat-containing protein n=1 Tax=Actinomadura kijaniata TaxID=46161 RepID=UPI00082AAE6C|nr:pentapeptide repeat-containing protein [Actinomadura kijaniata]